MPMARNGSTATPSRCARELARCAVHRRPDRAPRGVRGGVDRAGASRGRGSLLTALELFAGGGGAAMGIHRAGLHTLARCEWDRDACATLRAAGDAGHIDAAAVIEGDVRAVDWSPYVGRVDLMWASPPCQAWSSAGKRLGASDDRNGWPWTFDAVDTVRPTWLLAENVTGLLMHRGDCDGKGAPDDCPGCYFHRHILPEARKRFASVQWAILNSSAFGVPQHRRRVYLVCGPRPIAWPVATHGDPARSRGLFGDSLIDWVTMRDGLKLWGVGRVADGSPTILDRPAPSLTGGSHKSHVNGRSILSASASARSKFSAAGLDRLTPEHCAVLMGWPRDYPRAKSQTIALHIAANGCTPAVVELLCRAVGAITRA